MEKHWLCSICDHNDKLSNGQTKNGNNTPLGVAVSTNTVTPAQNETHHWELARTQVTKCLLHGNVVITDNYNTNFPQKPRSQNGKLL